MITDNDYDEDGNNIVPCPICLSEFCLSKEGEKCPEEDEFAKAHESEQKEEWEEGFGADSEWLIPLYTDEVSVEDKKIAVRRLIALAKERGRREEVILFMESIQKKAETVTPNLLLNEVVNYAYDRIKTITQKL